MTAPPEVPRAEAAGAKRLLRPYGDQAPTNPAGAR